MVDLKREYGSGAIAFPFSVLSCLLKLFACPYIIKYKEIERTVTPMEYMSAPEAAKKWGISERRVQKLCEESRIQGVSRFGRMWLIPQSAEKPLDGRLKEVQTERKE